MTLPPNTDYTARDFSSINARLQLLLLSAFPTWTDTDRADFGNILREMFAWVGDVLGFYQDAQAREAFFGSATQRRSLLALAKLVGYAPTGTTPAAVDVTLTLSAPPSGDVTFPAGSTVRSAAVTDPVVFQSLAAATILSGASPPQVVVACEHSVSESDSFVSDDTPNQEFVLGASPYLDHSARPTATEGAYTRVANFLASTATDRHFVEVVDETGRCKLRFGNGINGRIPSGVIDVPYKTGVGTAGNVEAHALTTFDGQVLDALGNLVVVAVDNAQPAAGGGERESLESMRRLAPASLRSPLNSIGDDDFETHALMVPGVARALATGHQRDPGVEPGSVYVYVVPTGNGVADAALLAAVTTMVTVTYPCATTAIVLVISAPRAVLNIHAKIWPRSGWTAAAAATQVRADLVAYYALTYVDPTDGLTKPNPKVDFGFNVQDGDGVPTGLIALSDVANIVHDSVGVLRLGTADADFTINGAHADVVVANNQFSQLGATVDLVNGVTGASL